MKQNYMVEYTFDETQGLSATDFQYATIGFSTKVKQGILMQLKSVETPDYISVEMNNNGECVEQPSGLFVVVKADMCGR